MNTSAVEIRVEPPASADAFRCLKNYFSELAERFESGFDPAKSISAAADELIPPVGVFVIARFGGEPIGCGALKVTEQNIGEVKRMWVHRNARGLGLGRRILEKLEKLALEFGCIKLRLET
jgi:GNAT superfamily N-acetyltransferase